MTDKEINDGLVLSWNGGLDLDYWREDMMDRFVGDGMAEEEVEELQELTDDQFFLRYSDWYNSDAEFEWEYVVEALTELLKEFSGYWHAEVSHFGWQGRDGQKDFTADEGQDFLRKLLPDCDCHFKIYRDDHPGSPIDWADGVARPTKGLKIQNFHHDSPMGREWYYVLDVGDMTVCSGCDKWFLEEDQYEHTDEDGYWFCEASMCMACGKTYYEEDEDGTD